MGPFSIQNKFSVQKKKQIVIEDSHIIIKAIYLIFSSFRFLHQLYLWYIILLKSLEKYQNVLSRFSSNLECTHTNEGPFSNASSSIKELNWKKKQILSPKAKNDVCVIAKLIILLKYIPNVEFLTFFYCNFCFCINLHQILQTSFKIDEKVYVKNVIYHYNAGHVLKNGKMLKSIQFIHMRSINEQL